MAATTPVAFDPDPETLAGGIPGLKAASAILAGQVVAFADTGTSRTVAPATSSLSTPVGVALNSASTGEPVAIAGNGSVVKVMMSTDNGTLDAGHWVMTSSVAGCVIEWDPAIGTHAATVDTGAYPLGFAVDDSTTGGSTVGSTVKILVNICPLFTASS